jgi:hypothetical protein
MSLLEIESAVQGLTLDQLFSIYINYIKTPIIHTRTIYDSDGKSYPYACIHESLICLLPRTEYEINGEKLNVQHRIFDDIHEVLSSTDVCDNINTFQTAVIKLYNIFETVKTGHPKFDNKMREISERLRRKLLSHHIHNENHYNKQY